MILSLDFSSETPIYLQIRNQILLAIAGGKTKARGKAACNPDPGQ